MKAVLVGAAAGAFVGFVLYVLLSEPSTRDWDLHGRDNTPQWALAGALFVVPMATLGAVIGGFQAVLAELRAIRRQHEFDAEPLREKSTGIKEV